MITETMYNGNKISFDDETHLYTVNGMVKVSCTQVMSRVGVKESDDAPFRPISGFFGKGEYISNAQVFGKALHKIAEWIVQGRKFNYDPAMQPWIDGLNRFMDDYGKDIKFDSVEMVGYSKIYDYCGTIDIVGGYKDHPLILDWKTSTVISKSWNLQTASYEQIVKEGSKFKGNYHRWAVQIKENGYHIVKRQKEKEDFNKFISILNVYKAFK